MNQSHHNRTDICTKPDSELVVLVLQDEAFWDAAAPLLDKAGLAAAVVGVALAKLLLEELLP